MSQTSSIQHALKNTELQLVQQVDVQQQGVNNCQLEAEILLAYCLGKSRTYLRTYPEQIIEPDILIELQKLTQRRIDGVPIAYITGYREFWSLDFITNEHTLIPRPETELLVELALQKISADEPMHIADLGTGSGAIAASIATERPTSTIIATDISEPAIAVARQNARHLSLNNIQFHCGEWFAPILGEMFNIIISNPPYVASNDSHLEQGDLRFEPRRALESGTDGLDAIRHIINESKHYLLDGGWLLLEHGYDQRETIISLLEQSGFCNVAWYDDLQGQARAIIGQVTTATE